MTATTNGGTASYVYDGNGLRVSKIVNGQTTIYVYDAWGTLAAGYGSFTTACNTPTCYVTVDHLGSTRMVTDTSGSPPNAHRYDYLPFGEQILSGTNRRSPGMGCPFSPDAGDPEFTSQYRDPDTGLDWFDTRYMSGGQGRFQSVDPANAGAALGDPQSWNGYTYVGNNPLTFTDPSGMFACAACVGAGEGPFGAIIGRIIDLGFALFGIFGGGGGFHPQPLPDVQGPVLQPSPDADWQWNDQIPDSTDPDGLCDPGSLWNERVPGRPGMLNVGGLFGGGNLASILGIQMPNPWVFSVNPYVQVQSWYSRLLERLQKIELSPDSPAVPHWRTEVRSFARQIMSKAEQVTKGRRAKALEKYLQRTLGVSADELSKHLRTPIIFIDTCKLDPYQPMCLGRRSSGPMY